VAQTVTFLENALKAWEDKWLFYEASNRLLIYAKEKGPEVLRGPMRHWRELRNHILTLKGNDFDVTRFCPMEDDLGASAYTTVPLQLASWTLDSRRVFQLNSELVNKFATAELPAGLKWSDLLWPFDAFAISLEEPYMLQGDSDDIALEMILVTSVFKACSAHEYSKRDGFEVRYFLREACPLEDAERCVLTSNEREALEKRLKKKQWVKLQRDLGKIAEKIRWRFASGNIPSGMQEPSLLKKEGLVGDDPYFKIIAGFCLYLEALPPGTMEGYGWQQVPLSVRKQAQGFITDGEQVCRIENLHTLSPATLAEFPQSPRRGPAYTVTPHWRRAHYRRARGQGNNPHAPRDVEVSAALIHKEHLPPGSIPGGAQSKVI